MINLLRQVWNRLSLYLPFALMGLFALGTYWLVQRTPVANTSAVVRPVRHEPDYFMKNFSVRTFLETGRLKNEVLGVAARHYPDSDTLEIDVVRSRSFDDKGILTTATANRALTSGDATEVQLFGNARIVRDAQVDIFGQASPRLEFKGEYLHVLKDPERVWSDRPVELHRGTDIFSADAMDFDNAHQILNLRGRVRGTLVPAPGK